MRNATLVGLPILAELKYDEENTWNNGKVYDPEHGKFYNCRIKVEGAIMKLRGYIWGLPFLGRTNTWVRAK